MTARRPFSLGLAACLLALATAGFDGAARAQQAPPPTPANAASQPPAPPPETSAPSQPAPGQTPADQAPPNYGPPPGYGAPPPSTWGAPPPYGPPPGYGYGAQPGYPPPGYPPPQAPAVWPPSPIHDGLYLHLHLGIGYMRIAGGDGAGNSIKLTGTAVSFGLAVGGALAPNLILFGNLVAVALANPDVNEGGMDYGSPNGSAVVAGLGAGLVYYLEPYNVYFSGALEALSFELDDSDGNSVYQSKVGLGFEGMVGKEWWVSQRVGLGVAGELLAASMTDKNDSSVSWGATSFTVLFSATY